MNRNCYFVQKGSLAEDVIRRNLPLTPGKIVLCTSRELASVRRDLFVLELSETDHQQIPPEKREAVAKAVANALNEGQPPAVDKPA